MTYQNWAYYFSDITP